MVTGDVLQSWVKQIERVAARITKQADDLCDCQQAAADDLRSLSDKVADLAKEIHMAWVDIIAKEAP
jgi:hypothetical protein